MLRSQNALLILSYILQATNSHRNQSPVTYCEQTIFCFLYSLIFSALQTVHRVYNEYIFYRTVYCVVSSRMYVIERIFELYGL